MGKNTHSFLAVAIKYFDVDGCRLVSFVGISEETLLVRKKKRKIYAWVFFDSDQFLNECLLIWRIDPWYCVYLSGCAHQHINMRFVDRICSFFYFKIVQIEMRQANWSF